jgi:hypothetical protein
LSERVAVISWSRVRTRTRDLATAIDATDHTFRSFEGASALTRIARYVVDSFRTAWFLLRARPTSVVVVSPPFVPVVLVALWARLSGVIYIVDAHPGAWGLKDNHIARAALPAHVWAIRRAAAVCVPSDAIARRAAESGASPIVLYDPPLSGERLSREPPSSRLFTAGLFASDEPFDVIVEVARKLSFEVHAFGPVERSHHQGVKGDRPSNLVLRGFVEGPAYYAEMQKAIVVIALTSEPSSVMRVACEATWLEVPLVVTDSPASRSAFPFAWHCTNDVDAVVDCVHQVLGRESDAVRRTRAGREVLSSAVAAQVERVRAVVHAGRR